MGSNASKGDIVRTTESTRRQNTISVGVQDRILDEDELIASAFKATDTVKPPSQPTQNNNERNVHKKSHKVHDRIVVVTDQTKTQNSFSSSQRNQSLLQAANTNKLSGAPMATDRAPMSTNQPFVTNREMIYNKKTTEEHNVFVNKTDTYSTSKAYYDKKQSAGKKHPNNYHSGVYNRHQGHQGGYDRGVVEQKGKRANDLNSLLKKDKLTLLGVQLQEQESKLFAKHKESSFHIAKADRGNNDFSIRQLPQNFDPNKFKAVNETSKFDWKSSSNGVNSPLQSHSNSRVTNQRTIAPLDDYDEELIAQLEQEFDGVPSVG